MKKINWDNRNFDDINIFNNELKEFFTPPNLVGFKPLLNENNYYVTEYLHDRFLITKTDKYNLLNNCCLHKNARLVEGSDKIRRGMIVCPIHYWSYNFNGELINAPFSNINCKQTNLNIKSTSEIYSNNGFLFSNENLFNEIKKSNMLKDINLDDYSLIIKDSEEYDGNWKEYGIVYNDTNHVRMFHPEMATVLDIDSTEWEFGKDYSVHRHKFKANWRLTEDNNFTKYFKLLEKEGFDIKNDELNNYAVTFLTIYPNVFIDKWAGMIWVDYVNPISESKYVVFSMGFCDNKIIDNDKIIKFYKDAYYKVGEEDKIILTKIYKGRKNLNAKNNKYSEYITDYTEEGNISYIEWIHKNGFDFYQGEFTVENIET